MTFIVTSAGVSAGAQVVTAILPYLILVVIHLLVDTSLCREKKGEIIG